VAAGPELPPAYVLLSMALLWVAVEVLFAGDAVQRATAGPTRFVKQRMLEHGKRTGLPPYAYKKLLDTADVHRRAVELAIRSGVAIAAGTDSITTGPDSALAWGLHALELAYLVDAGMTPLRAIEAATAAAPATLGPQAPRAGLLAAGYDADLIAVTGDPTKDISLLCDARNITHVIKAGRLEKQPMTVQEPL
jgi:imidazolonepropionase-like amidohydrolase